MLGLESLRGDPLDCSVLGDNGCSITLPKLMLEVRPLRKGDDDDWKLESESLSLIVLAFLTHFWTSLAVNETESRLLVKLDFS